MRRWAHLLLLLAVLLPAAAHARNRLTLMLDWLPNPDEAPVFIAKHEGFFGRHSLDVAISYQPQLYLLADRACR